MVASQKDDFLREFYLESHQETNGLQRVIPSVDVVSKKDVVVRVFLVDPSVNLRVARRAEHVKESHQVRVLSVDVSEDFDWRFRPEKHRLIFEYFLSLSCQLKNLGNFERKLDVLRKVLITDRSEQGVDELLSQRPDLVVDLFPHLKFDLFLRKTFLRLDRLERDGHWGFFLQTFLFLQFLHD